MLAIGLGVPELAIIAGIIVLLFGATALPKFAKGLGQAKKEFEKGFEEGEKEASKSDDEPKEK